MIKIVGLTGGIGSGKTTCAKIFAELGIPIYYSDSRAKEIMHTNEKLRQNLIETFGSQSYSEDGTLNRAYLAELIFKDKNAVAQINAIVHPAVRQDFFDWIQLQGNASYVMQESALLFETGSYKSFDKIVLVDAPEDIRIQRVITRDKVTGKAVQERINKQLPSAQKRSLSDFIIENDGQQGLMKQIIAIHMALLEK